MELNKIIIAGGTGALGKLLTKEFLNQGAKVIVLTRNPKESGNPNLKYVYWDAVNNGDWSQELENSNVIINLTGKSVNCRYTAKNKREIIESRTLSTLAIGKAVDKLNNPPKVWINAGSAAIFGNSGPDFKTEQCLYGDGFSSDVCKKWENAFFEIETPNTRKIFLRIGMVLQVGEGVIKPFMNMAKMGFGGKIGNGEQFITWIHEKDFMNIINWSIQHESMNGILHCASPEPVTNKEFMIALKKACHVPFGLPTPALAVRLGAMVIGTEPELVLSGRRVISTVLDSEGFKFKYPQINHALQDLIA
ncbi:TIGR01777 family protein [Solitalea longa]|uniref:TIGR01777 family protein n=1 Tax=Solitalea longa TaxID=2079460 RepID=A0A2S5AA07_9SPHI|nr:TIGR01777 family oxidoreductase [Solitalea longa]POY38953.1 TIGR01777 family protein [Solitalea longa]